MEKFRQMKLADIVSKHPAAAILFEKHRLDYCCKGKQKLEESCRFDSERIEVLESELQELMLQEAAQPDPIRLETLPLARLLDYILEIHHHYLKELLPLIQCHAERVAVQYSDRHPELREMLCFTAALRQELEHHLYHQEQEWFPAIRGQLNQEYHTLSLGKGIQKLGEEMDISLELMDKLEALTGGFKNPEPGCMMYELFYQELKTLKEDLHQHFYLESHLLFPRAMGLEKQNKAALSN